MGPLIYKWDASFIQWDPSFINEDIYVSVGTNGTPYQVADTTYSKLSSQPWSQSTPRGARLATTTRHMNGAQSSSPGILPFKHMYIRRGVWSDIRVYSVHTIRFSTSVLCVL